MATKPNPAQTRLQEEQYEITVPAVRDRIVQAALKIVLEPVFEADFLPCSFGFRPGRSPQDALQVLTQDKLIQIFHLDRYAPAVRS
jgi:RNA-directed DNA polymerase